MSHRVFSVSFASSTESQRASGEMVSLGRSHTPFRIPKQHSLSEKARAWLSANFAVNADEVWHILHCPYHVVEGVLPWFLFHVKASIYRAKAGNHRHEIHHGICVSWRFRRLVVQRPCDRGPSRVNPSKSISNRTEYPHRQSRALQLVVVTHPNA